MSGSAGVLSWQLRIYKRRSARGCQQFGGNDRAGLLGDDSGEDEGMYGDVRNPAVSPRQGAARLPDGSQAVGGGVVVSSRQNLQV